MMNDYTRLQDRAMDKKLRDRLATLLDYITDVELAAARWEAGSCEHEPRYVRTARRKLIEHVLGRRMLPVEKAYLGDKKS